MAYLSKYTGPDIDRRLAQGTYDDAVAAGFTGSKEEFDKLLAAFNPQEQEKLNSKQDKEDPALETENKTVVGAINYLNSNKQDKTDERLTTDSKIVVEAINEVKYNTIVLDQKKQPREDLGFSTEQKTVVGAVNELNLKIGELDASKQNAVDDIYKPVIENGESKLWESQEEGTENGTVTQEQYNAIKERIDKGLPVVINVLSSNLYITTHISITTSPSMTPGRYSFCYIDFNTLEDKFYIKWFRMESDLTCQVRTKII